MSSFDVRVFAIRRRAGRAAFEVRWRVAGRDRSRSFMTRALADSFRAELVRAARRGAGFDPATGEPGSWTAPGPEPVTWYRHAVAYAQVKWPRGPSCVQPRTALGGMPQSRTRRQRHWGDPASVVAHLRATAGWGLPGPLGARPAPPVDLVAASLRCGWTARSLTAGWQRSVVRRRRFPGAGIWPGRWSGPGLSRVPSTLRSAVTWATAAAATASSCSGVPPTTPSAPVTGRRR